MRRNPITVRAAEPEDAPALVALWAEQLRRADRSEQVADIELIIKQAAATPEQRLVVVEYDGGLAGAALLRLSTVSPLNLEPCVQAIQPRVLPELRSLGVGTALMEAATAFAEECGAVLVTVVVPSPDRDANRFMARLGLSQLGTWRVAPTTLLRDRLTPAKRPAGPAGRTGRVGRNRLLAARRSARRARSVEQVTPADLGVEVSED